MLSQAIESVQAAKERAMAVRPSVGGFPYLAEILRRAGVTRNVWVLPACQSVHVTKDGTVVTQDTPLLYGTSEVPSFDQAALVKALRINQTGKSSFPEFLASSWKAGVIGYDVDFMARKVTYYGCQGERYIESYPEVAVE